MKEKQYTMTEAIGNGVDVRFTGSYIPGAPGRLDGLPENCYPTTPEHAEIDRITVTISGNTYGEMFQRLAMLMSGLLSDTTDFLVAQKHYDSAWLKYCRDSYAEEKSEAQV